MILTLILVLLVMLAIVAVSVWSSFLTSDTNPTRVLPITTRAATLLSAIVVLYSVSQLVRGLTLLLSASPPHNDYPERFEQINEMASLIYQQKITRGLIECIAGIVLAIAGVVVWRCRRKLQLDCQSNDFEQLFHRFALYGLTAAVIGATAPFLFGGVSFAFYLVFLKCVLVVVLVGLGLSFTALALGRDLRISIPRAILPYVFAILGAGLSGYNFYVVVSQDVRDIVQEYRTTH